MFVAVLVIVFMFVGVFGVVCLSLCVRVGPGYQKENCLYPIKRKMNVYQKQTILSQRAAPATANRLGSPARCESGCADFVAGTAL